MYVIYLLHSILPQENKWPLLYPVSYTLGGHLLYPSHDSLYPTPFKQL